MPKLHNQKYKRNAQKTEQLILPQCKDDTQREREANQHNRKAPPHPQAPLQFLTNPSGRLPPKEPGPSTTTNSLLSTKATHSRASVTTQTLWTEPFTTPRATHGISRPLSILLITRKPPISRITRLLLLRTQLH